MAADYFEGQKKVSFLTLDNTLSLKQNLDKNKKISLLFAIQGEAASEIAARVKKPDRSQFMLMPSAIQRAGFYNGTGYALPVILNHFEVAYNIQTFRENGIAEPETIYDLITAAEKIKKPSFRPVICAGAKDSDLLFLVGSLTESYCTVSGWQALVAAMKQDTAFTDLLDLQLSVQNTDIGSLRDVLDLLIQLKNNNILHPEWLRINDRAVEGLMGDNLADIVFMTLLTHRSVPQRTIERYTATAVPPADRDSPRGITAPPIIGMLPSRRANAKSQDFLYYLVNQNGQKNFPN
ncbi:hypothetical protein K7I13_09785 [Brucepastera parasyntrophica]|uniref:hypothetical protein n=1 Tax=Brucepastera parasyntrophica TaxID=2880008 RepID=UPI00210DE92C|nr:hypothetical protein [Brucepastera parasyntrophica]ULQ58823.1 hypothetical protein K7I13_09785 [Brucepastera parasyntrophica]